MSRHFLHGRPGPCLLEVLAFGERRREVSVVRTSRLARLPGHVHLHGVVEVREIRDLVNRGADCRNDTGTTATLDRGKVVRAHQWMRELRAVDVTPVHLIPRAMV